MNPSESSPPPLSNDHRVVDAALRELARTGSEVEDAPLVRSILLATVDRVPANVTELPKRPHELRPWLLGAGAVAATVGLVIAALQALPYGNKDRSHSEIQFVITVTPSPAEPDISTPVSTPPSLAGVPYQGEVEVVISSKVGGQSFSKTMGRGAEEEWTYPLPVAVATPLAPGPETLEIDSDRVREESGQLVYSGNVELRYRSFLISADSIRLRTEREPGSSAFLTAENASFSSENEETYPITAAEAGELEIDPVSGLIRLRDIDRLETLENGRISIVDTQEVLITAAGYAIETRK